MRAILCFGDSITHGVGEYPCKSWAGRLKEEFESQYLQYVYTLGVPGDRTTRLLTRFEPELERIQWNYPDDHYLIILAIGMNDAKDGETTDEEFAERFEELLTQAEATKAEMRTLLITPVDEEKTCPWEGGWYRNARIDEFNTIITRLAREHNVPVIDVNTPMRDKPELLADGLHPNSDGYTLMFNTIKQELGAWLDG